MPANTFRNLVYYIQRISKLLPPIPPNDANNTPQITPEDFLFKAPPKRIFKVWELCLGCLVFLVNFLTFSSDICFRADINVCGVLTDVAKNQIFSPFDVQVNSYNSVVACSLPPLPACGTVIFYIKADYGHPAHTQM